MSVWCSPEHPHLSPVPRCTAAPRSEGGGSPAHLPDLWLLHLKDDVPHVHSAVDLRRGLRQGHGRRLRRVRLHGAELGGQDGRHDGARDHVLGDREPLPVQDGGRRWGAGITSQAQAFGNGRHHGAARGLARGGLGMATGAGTVLRSLEWRNLVRRRLGTHS